MKKFNVVLADLRQKRDKVLNNKPLSLKEAVVFRQGVSSTAIPLCVIRATSSADITPEELFEKKS